MVIVLSMILSISLLTACTRSENTKWTKETTAPVSRFETVPIEDTEPADTNPVETVPQISAQGQNANYYSMCTSYSKFEVEQFAKEIKELILAEDWKNLSEYVAYPITMAGVTYEDRSSFLAAPFDTLLDAAAVASIQEESCTDMFFNYSGIMMGNGEVWIGEILNEDYSSAGLHVLSLKIIKEADAAQ